MNVVETILIFGGIPLGIFAVILVAVYGRTAATHNPYRPGRPWTYDPVWYLPHPANAEAHRNSGAIATLPAATVAAAEPERMGGASGEW